MTVAAPLRELVDTVDHRVVLHGVSWSDFERILEVRGDTAGVRMAYLEGELELMSPSRDHEGIKKCFARLVEAWADERGLELNGYGSWTLRSAPRERGVEPDECYIVGDPEDKEVPDFAIEVVWTSGGIDKLEIYRGLGVRELWVWRDSGIEVLALRGDRYEPIDRSEILPELDLDDLATYLQEPSQAKAVRTFRERIRQR